MSAVLDVDALAAIVARRVVDELELRAKQRAEVLLTPEQMAVKLGVAIKTLANMRSKGTGPHFIKVGGAVRYPVAPEEVKP